MVDRIGSGSKQRAFAMVRPPGHHAEAGRAMGFCLFNNVAVAAAHARATGARRVAIVDYDVHHGNGTQHMFERDASVLYVSTHQFPFYPGTGANDEVGTDAGTGFTVNVPLEAHATDSDYQLVFANVVLPIVRQFQPDLVLVSAGFDAHERDPLGGMRVTTAGYRAMTAELRVLADGMCDGRIALITEGGYDLPALGACIDAAIEVLAPDDASPAAWPSTEQRPLRGSRAVDAARAALGRCWTI